MTAYRCKIAFSADPDGYEIFGLERGDGDSPDEYDDGDEEYYIPDEDDEYGALTAKHSLTEPPPPIDLIAKAF